jgi:uncharacterized membrane protein
MGGMSARPSPSTAFLIALLGGSGVLHFARPGPFVAIVPRSLSHKRELVYLSGAAELLGAAMMAVPATRRMGGMFAAGVLVGVFPANVSMAVGSGRKSPWYRAVLWGRLPLQAPLVLWALRSGRESTG